VNVHAFVHPYIGLKPLNYLEEKRVEQRVFTLKGPISRPSENTLPPRGELGPLGQVSDCYKITRSTSGQVLVGLLNVSVKVVEMQDGQFQSL
jgi:hypothetical protein